MDTSNYRPESTTFTQNDCCDCEAGVQLWRWHTSGKTLLSALGAELACAKCHEGRRLWRGTEFPDSLMMDITGFYVDVDGTQHPSPRGMAWLRNIFAKACPPDPDADGLLKTLWHSAVDSGNTGPIIKLTE